MSTAELKAHAFVLPVMQGFVSELRQLDFTKLGGRSVNADLVLIARRSVKRLGTRNWRRGADQQVRTPSILGLLPIDWQGSVANFVETEQLVTFSTGDKCSFVQLRGSVPVFWTSIPNVKYKPPTKLGRETDYTHAFDAHVEDLLQSYKAKKSISGSSAWLNFCRSVWLLIWPMRRGQRDI